MNPRHWEIIAYLSIIASAIMALGILIFTVTSQHAVNYPGQQP